ncbi:M24 family metallopeptidase [Candidatus Daviesbacteria bacterium]|nr:M24 family metallopeptidase [Candidatus Daviesbacteria bacterium]
MNKDKIGWIRAQLKKEGLDAVLICSKDNITYLTGYPNFSEKEREAYIFAGYDFAYIITDARYTHEVKTQVTDLEIFERSHSNPTEKLFKKHKIKILGVEEDNLTISEHKYFKKHFKKIKHIDLGNFRSVKTEDEIKKIEKACDIGDLAFKYIVKKIKEGVSEKELAGELENFIRSKGAVLSFPTIVAFGKNSAIPHHHTSDDKLDGNSQFILFDFGVKFENYCSDMTRTVFFGSPDKNQIKMYETVLGVQQKVVNAVNSGERKTSRIFKIADKFIKSKGFQGLPHSLGHGIGLEVHEHPSLSLKSKEVLKEGMVFSIEPGIYLSDFGGIRIEDLFVLEKTGLRQLTKSSKNLMVLY